MFGKAKPTEEKICGEILSNTFGAAILIADM
jgi:hypothetical protein